jgi:hypothetical protein
MAGDLERSEFEPLLNLLAPPARWLVPPADLAFATTQLGAIWIDLTRARARKAAFGNTPTREVSRQLKSLWPRSAV